jgi:uncharacterized protein YrrD
MFQLSQSFLNRPVMSLRTGSQVATSLEAIINPNNLKIEGFYCQDSKDKKQRLVLLSQDIRDVVSQGLVINDQEVLTPPQDLVRLKKTMDINFSLLGKPVATVSKDRLGKVSDYAVEVETLYISKIYVSQSVLKSLSGGGLIINRDQIVEITNKKIVVQDIVQPTSAAVSPATAPVN